MTWLQRYQLKRSLRWSLWLVPVAAIALAVVVAPLVRRLDRAIDWSLFQFTPMGAQAILGAFTSSMLTLVVFVVSSLLIVVQLASAQLTPRIIAIVFATRRLKMVLGMFSFTYAYTIAASGRIEATVPQLTVAVAILCNLVSLALFFWFVQSLGGSLRPISVLHEVADTGRTVVENVYPHAFDPAEAPRGWSPAPTADVVEVEHVGTTGTLMAFSQEELLALANRGQTVIELVPQVGDFVARGDLLFRIHKQGAAADVTALRNCVAIGPERTMQQDPRFAFRILVDIANKALSPAINDPTTAVLALDQIDRLLMYVGGRRLDAGEIRDAQGRLRLCYGTPDWIDFVSLGVSEIRHYGASSIQVARRLNALLTHLLRVLPEARHAALQHELALLARAIQRCFPDAEDRAQAQISDVQGIGSSKLP